MNGLGTKFENTMQKQYVSFGYLTVIFGIQPLRKLPQEKLLNRFYEATCINLSRHPFTTNAEDASSPKDLTFRASDSQEKYGFRYFDKPIDYDEDEEDDAEDFEEKTCSASCCDKDCECDDCLRCANEGTIEHDSYANNAVAA